MTAKKKKPNAANLTEGKARIKEVRAGSLFSEGKSNEFVDKNSGKFQNILHVIEAFLKRDTETEVDADILEVIRGFTNDTSAGKIKSRLALALFNLSAAKVRKLETLLLESPLAEDFSQNAVHPLGDPDLPAKAPELWSERTTGRKVSPADFIRKNYEQWLGKGLTRAHIGILDKPLYTAYAKQIKRTPEAVIDGLPTDQRIPYDDPEEALERIREGNRRRTAKHRMAM